jgi:hypothetical protein
MKKLLLQKVLPLFLIIETIMASYICSCINEKNCGTDLDTCERVFVNMNITKSDFYPQRYGLVCKRNSLLGIKNFCEGEYGCILPRIQILKEKVEKDIPVYLTTLIVEKSEITAGDVLNSLKSLREQNLDWYADLNDKIAKVFNFSLLGWRETYNDYQPLGNLSGICLKNYLNCTNNVLVLNQTEYLFICINNIYAVVNGRKLYFNQNFGFRCYSRYYYNNSISAIQNSTIVYLNETRILEIPFFPPDNYSSTTEYNENIQNNTKIYLFIYILVPFCFLSVLTNIILIYKTCRKKKNRYHEISQELQNANLR